uniref:Uncharacterized protein n=1 Tax=Podoviridae sp. ctIi96 TaxID=2826550 RepID=A0A8S5M1P2_9CAUD|nr:MAG TPA: hypothetical protein [Podoviridae sp. ctIi96]
MDRNYFIGTPEGGNSGGSKFDIMAFLPSLMGGGGKSLDPNLVAALMNNKGNQDAWGGGGCWWIWIILLFFVWGGWGGNGFGNNGANGLPAQLNNDAGREMLMNAIQGNGTAINQLASSLNCSTQQLQTAICNIQGQIQQVGNQVGMSSQQIINALQSGNNQLLTQIAECCCTVNNNITKMGYENQLASCNQTNTLVNTMNNNTLQLRDSNLANTQAILQKVDAFEARYQADKFAAVTAENLALKGQISQINQNGYFAATMQAQTAPLANALTNLSDRLAKIECGLPPTVAVPYPQLQAFNPEIARAAAYGAYAGDRAARGTSCGC